MPRIRAGLSVTLAACGLLALLRCDLLTQSVFPSYLPFLEETRDLSDYLGGGYGSELEVLSLGSGDRLFLIISPPDASARLLVMNEDLEILADYDEGSVRDALGGSGSFGRTVMIDALGDYVVGNFVFDDATLHPLLSTSDVAPGTPGDVAGVAHLPGFANYLMWADNTGDPALFHVEVRNSAWAAPTSFSSELAPQAFSLSLERAVRTYQPPETYFLTFGSYENVVIVAVSAFDIESGSPLEPLLDTVIPVNYPWFVIEDAEAASVQFTADGFVVRKRNGERQLWGDGGLKDTYQPEESESDVDEAYSPIDDHYYVLDRDRKTLNRLSIWW